jgi:gluconolactonase
MNSETIVKAKKIPWFSKARVRQIASGFLFTEGPVWHPDQYFLFSDTPANRIYQLFANGKTTVYLEKSGLSHSYTGDLSEQVGSNGLALNNINQLFICQHGNHAIAVLDENKQLRTLINEYDGLPFNSPNDLVFCSNGLLFFTDPPYGLAGQVLHPDKFQPWAGIYKYDGHTVELVGRELQYPNGVCFSPDEEWLYVSTNHPNEQYILKYRVSSNGDIRYEGILVKENADGIKTDREGNIYLATGEGILIVSPLGEKLGLIGLPGMATNLAWGGAHEEILCVTAGSSIYLVTSE